MNRHLKGQGRLQSWSYQVLPSMVREAETAANCALLPRPTIVCRRFKGNCPSLYSTIQWCALPVRYECPPTARHESCESQWAVTGRTILGQGDPCVIQSSHHSTYVPSRRALFIEAEMQCPLTGRDTLVFEPDKVELDAADPVATDYISKEFQQSFMDPS